VSLAAILSRIGIAQINATADAARCVATLRIEIRVAVHDGGGWCRRQGDTYGIACVERSVGVVTWFGLLRQKVPAWLRSRGIASTRAHGPPREVVDDL
jgi:hypothetical protein